jgi:GNAT superfamily N-acetyltransferase
VIDKIPPTLTVQVRTLQPEDAGAVARLSNELGYPVDLDQLKTRLKQRLQNADAVAFAAILADGSVVGWIDAAIEHHIQTESAVVIGGLVVGAEARGRGIGMALCRAVEEWTLAKSLKTVRVRSQIKREDAHRFYKREQYHRIKTSVVFEKTLQ